MKRILAIVLLCLIIHSGHSQGFVRKHFPNSSVDMQFAGSIGLWSVGAYKITKNEKIEIGAMFGNVPKSVGGPIQTMTIKLKLNSCSLDLSKNIAIQPIQTGIFLTQSFGENLDYVWSSKYPKGYYWWKSSLRSHIFVGTQVSYKLKNSSINKISLYAEANTNDLYLYSHFENLKTIKIYDIFFLGIGMKLHFK